MGLYDKLTGKASAGANPDQMKAYLLEGEEIIASYQFIRDSIVLTNLGIYMIDVQGVTGKKTEVKFYPKRAIKTITFETAGTLDLDVDIKIGVEGNTEINEVGQAINRPIAFKVPRGDAGKSKEIVNIVKQYYLCN